MRGADDSSPESSAPSATSAARFPEIAVRRPHYESYFLKACHPGGGLAVWIRYTVHKPPNAPARGFTWFTLFDGTSGVVASKAGPARPDTPSGAYVRIGESVFAPGRALGTAASAQLDASWDLRIDGDEPPVWHLPRWAYGAPLPRTKLLSPHPQVLVSGTVEAGKTRLNLDAWPGTVGHNWGSEHAYRTIWIHGTGFREREDAWVDLALARVKVGPFITPWIANGELALDGRRHRLGGIERVRSTVVEERVESCRFSLRGDGLSVSGEVSAARHNFVGWLYAQPKGGERQTINSSIADLRLQVAQARGETTVLELGGGAAYELQMAERYRPIPVQPFPDG
jgi:hypothetical protein